LSFYYNHYLYIFLIITLLFFIMVNTRTHRCVFPIINIQEMVAYLSQSY